MLPTNLLVVRTCDQVYTRPFRERRLESSVGSPSVNLPALGEPWNALRCSSSSVAGVSHRLPEMWQGGRA